MAEQESQSHQSHQEGGGEHDDLLAILDDPNILYAKEFVLDTVKSRPERVPRRFNKMSNKKFRKEPHPMYSTSSTAYGAKDPQATDLPTKYYGRAGHFTRTFKGGRAHDSALNTFISTSKVHNAYDGSL